MIKGEGFSGKIPLKISFGSGRAQRHDFPFLIYQMEGTEDMKKRYHFLISMLVAVSVLLSAAGCSFQKKESKTTAQPKGATKSVTGVVTENNTDASKIQVRELDTDVVCTLEYAPTSQILDKYQSERDGDSIDVGEILHVTYYTDNAKVATAEVPEDVWEYQEVKKFKINADENMITVAGQEYQYTEMTYCGSENGEVQAMELNDQDILTVRGIATHAYSVVRTQGHGYIRLANYDDFKGGIAEVGDDGLMAQIGDNMLITAPEGIHRVTLFKNGCAASKTVEVADNRETLVDYSDYKTEAGDIGEVTFEIEPEGADLYLNGTSVDYSTPVTLNYGKYRLDVILSGYLNYTGILTVGKSTEVVRIDLVPANSAANNTATQAPTATAAPSTSNSDSAITKKIDSKHTITVTAPEFAEVYVDNVYKGMAPCTFTKIIGSLTITLSDTGYETKSYSVDVLDDGKNVKLSFAELVKSDSSSNSNTTTTTTSTPSPTATSTPGN